jgi:hypothetical protein
MYVYRCVQIAVDAKAAFGAIVGSLIEQELVLAFTNVTTS